MKLVRIYFNAFRSLLNEKLDINKNCMGFVGVNESGKSNILAAISILDENRQLSITDTPKMDKTNPYLKYEFELDSNEKTKLVEGLSTWVEKSTLIDKLDSIDDSRLFYHVLYDRKTDKEERFFTLNNFKLKGDCLFLKPECLTDKYFIKNKDSNVSLNAALVVQQKDIEENKILDKVYKDIKDNENDILSLSKEVKELSEQEDLTSSDQNKINEDDEIEQEQTQDMLSLQEKQRKIDVLKEKQKSFESQLGDYFLPKEIIQVEEIIADCDSKNEANKKLLKEASTALEELSKVTSPTTAQEQDIKVKKTEISKLEKNITNILSKKEKFENWKIFLEEPLQNKYSEDDSCLEEHLKPILQNIFSSLLPRLVFWEHNSKYILQDQTVFSDILEKDSIDDISRPLMNIFRIGLNVTSLDELKEKIKEIQNDPSERSRLTAQLTENVNKFIKAVWPDYKQKINISLEEDKIIIQIYDPDCEYRASYYTMLERSQGCQTFLSFLLTIGAESRHGVIKNTILLLDEPETHLHPSGVRYMLQELLKIAENSNLVLFATHSIFMIDRENYERHIILIKEKEITKIKPSQLHRIGLFMQEEVLYGTLDINLSKDFDSTNKYNFVFEGTGDSLLFQKYYEKVLKDKPFKEKNTSFYHGGKCSDIKKYFTSKPIQLGSKWVFILDKDDPANKLKNFIESRYRNYLNKDIFIFQYTKNGDEFPVELEDLLPSDFLAIVLKEEYEIIGSDIEAEISSSECFSEYLSKVILSKDEKSVFKDKLNKAIENKVEKISKKQFTDTFGDYYEWASGIMAKVSDSIKNLT